MKKYILLFLFILISSSNVFAIEIDKYEGYEEMYNLVETFLQNGNYIKRTLFIKNAYGKKRENVSFFNKNCIKEIHFIDSYLCYTDKDESVYIPSFCFDFFDGRSSNYYSTESYSIILDDNNNLIITEKIIKQEELDES